MTHRIKITIEVEGERPIVLLSTSNEKVRIAGFHFDGTPSLEPELRTSHRVSVVGELFGPIDELLKLGAGGAPS